MELGFKAMIFIVNRYVRRSYGLKYTHSQCSVSDHI